MKIRTERVSPDVNTGLEMRDVGGKLAGPR